MTMADLERLLRGNGWLNDEVINFYMLLINVNHFLVTWPGVACCEAIFLCITRECYHQSG